MNISNHQGINPGGHPVFPAGKDGGGLHASSVRFDGPISRRSHAHNPSPRWQAQAQTLRRASGYVGVERDGTTAPPFFNPLALDFMRSLLDRNGVAPPPAQVLALRVVVTSAVELDARQTELIARKMRRITGFANLKLENVVDPSLIAGFVVCYGTGDAHVIDLSVRGKLAALKNRVDSIDQTAAHAHGHPHHHH